MGIFNEMVAQALYCVLSSYVIVDKTQHRNIRMNIPFEFVEACRGQCTNNVVVVVVVVQISETHESIK